MATIVEHKHAWTKRAKRVYCRECKVDQVAWISEHLRRLTINDYRYRALLDDSIDEFLDADRR